MAVEFQEKVLQEFPQIVPETGVSGNYESEYQRFSFGVIDQGIWETFQIDKFNEMHAAAIEKLISHYEERFPSSSYDYSKITSDTKKIIASLDEIADEMNSLFAAKDYDRKKFYRLYVEALRIIFGENNKKYLELAKDLEEEFGKKEKKE